MHSGYYSIWLDNFFSISDLYYNLNLLKVQIFSGFLLIGIYFRRLGYIAYLKNPFSLAAAAAALRSLQAYDNYGGLRRRRRQAPNGE